MLTRLGQLCGQVLQALEHNAQASSALLDLAIGRPPDTVHRACHRGPGARDAPVPASRWDGRRCDRPDCPKLESDPDALPG